MEATQNISSLKPTPTAYEEKFCRNCEMGWSRYGIDGGVLTICLLDREKIMKGLKHCDHYAPKEELTFAKAEAQG